MFLRARPGSFVCHCLFSHSCSPFCMLGFVLSRASLEVSTRRCGFGRQCPCPSAVRDLCNWLGVCYCRGLSGSSSVNSELHLHVGIQWKTPAGWVMALDRQLRQTLQCRCWIKDPQLQRCTKTNIKSKHCSGSRPPLSIINHILSL